MATGGESIGEGKGSVFPQMPAHLGQLQAPLREFQSREPEALKSCFSGCALQHRGDHCLPLLLPLSHLCGPPASVSVKGPEPSLHSRQLSTYFWLQENPGLPPCSWAPSLRATWTPRPSSVARRLGVVVVVAAGAAGFSLTGRTPLTRRQRGEALGAEEKAATQEQDPTEYKERQHAQHHRLYGARPLRGLRLRPRLVAAGAQPGGSGPRARLRAVHATGVG